jgi:hypothetical protein
MNDTMTRHFLCLGLALLTWGCGGSPSTPTAARPPTPQPVPSGATQLAGIVYDSAERPLSGARVEVLDGPQAGQWAVTDGRGSYGFNGTFDDATRFRATMTGHVPAIGTRGARCAPCNPNWWLYFFLQPDGASADLTGDYTLTIAADPACSDLPAPARERTYTARIAHAVYGLHPPETTFKLTAGGASFLSAYGTLDVFVAGSAGGCLRALSLLHPTVSLSRDGALNRCKTVKRQQRWPSRRNFGLLSTGFSTETVRTTRTARGHVTKTIESTSAFSTRPFARVRRRVLHRAEGIVVIAMPTRRGPEIPLRSSEVLQEALRVVQEGLSNWTCSTSATAFHSGLVL